MFAYAAAIFLGAFLLFEIQPLIAKSILPWFGGSAAVWTTCLCFFQTALLAGYAWAHWLSRQSGRARAILHTGLLVLSLFSLPVGPSVWWKPAGPGNPAPAVFALLVANVGLPYLALASASPLLQAWFARTGGAPWRFFALSNAGSLLGLLSYPALIEPWLTRREQAWGWSAGYVAFAAVCASIAWRGRTAAHGAGSSNRWRLSWFTLAALPSALLMAVTQHLTENLAPIPLLWVAPLSLYLLSFVLCFERAGWYRRPLFLVLAAASLAAMTRESVPVFLAAAFVVFVTCHGELAARRPAPSDLTAFYLAISAGGAFGGLAIALVAPSVFEALYDLPILLAVCAGALVWLLPRPRSDRGWVAFTLAAGLAAGFAFVVLRDAWAGVSYARLRVRNFYGSFLVYDDGPLRALRHGAIEHGSQFLRPEDRRRPTAYYSHSSGVGLALDALMREGPVHVGIVGLGAGTLFAYSRPGDRFVAYEINPAILRIAATGFTFLSDSPAAKEVVLGDGRLSLEREPSRGFDLLALDAFSGDTIPAHLLTQEAFELYRRHLKPDGVLAVHVSNQYLNLAPVVALAARERGAAAWLVSFGGSRVTAESSSDWVLVTTRPGFFDLPPLRQAARSIDAIPGLAPWSDDFSNLYRVLR